MPSDLIDPFTLDLEQLAALAERLVCPAPGMRVAWCVAPQETGVVIDLDSIPVEVESDNVLDISTGLPVSDREQMVIECCRAAGGMLRHYADQADDGLYSDACLILANFDRGIEQAVTVTLAATEMMTVNPYLMMGGLERMKTSLFTPPTEIEDED